MHSSHTTLRLRVVVAFAALLTLLFSATAAHAADWTSFRGNIDNNAVTTARTPQTSAEASLKWSRDLKAVGSFWAKVGSPVISGTALYVPVDATLQVVDKNTGVITKSIALPFDTDYTSRPVIGNGAIFVPLAGGRICAISLTTHNVLWTTPAVTTFDSSDTTQTHQSLSTPLFDGTKLYFATTFADWTASYRGELLCIDTSLETTNAADRIVWTHDNKTSGYYWSGAQKFGSAIVIAGDDGMLTSLNAETGAVIAMKPLGTQEQVRTTIVAYKNQAILTTKSGRLYRVAINSDGTFGKGAWSARFAADSTITPAIFNNIAYVGGKNLDATSSNKGVFCAINLATMEVIRRVETPSISQSSPLVSSANSMNPYAYFSMNNMPGGLYAMSLTGTSGLDTIFEPSDPALQNFCMSSAIADTEGTLYYTNDSGNLFAIKSTPTPAPVIAPVVVKSNEARISKVVKSAGTWKVRFSMNRFYPRYSLVVLKRSQATVTLKAYKRSSASRLYMRTSKSSWKRINRLTLKLKRGGKQTVYIKCVSESGKVVKKYRVIVKRRF